MSVACLQDKIIQVNLSSQAKENTHREKSPTHAHFRPTKKKIVHGIVKSNSNRRSD